MGRIGAILLWLSLSGCSSLLYFPSRQLHFPPEKVGLQPEEVYFPSADGTRLFGWYFPTRSREPAKATVVFFHGNAENLSSHYLNMIWILEHPVDLFIFDYQGYGRSEGSPSPENTVQDGLGALAWAAARSPERPLVVFGQSLGGAVAMRTAIEANGRYPVKLVAVDSTFASYRSMGRQVLSRNLFTWPFQWLAWLLMSDAWAPDGKIASLSPTPLLVIHGTQDQVVEFEMGECVYEQAAEPKEFWKIAGGGHTDVFAIQDPSFRKRFVEKVLKAAKGEL